MDRNIFYDPQAFGLTMVASADIAGSWRFDKFVIWSDGDTLYWATDSGCSCPTPFEDYDRTNLNTGSLNDILKAISSWGTDSYDGRSVIDARMSLMSAVNDWRFAKKGM